MTDEEYWEMFHRVRGDIEGAVATNIVYLKIHNMAAGDRGILQKYYRSSEFWRLNAYALQTTFFISLGRVFDKRKDSWSIYDVVDNTIEHPGMFSKSSLRERKRAGSAKGNKDPDWLENYMANSWAPTRKDLTEVCSGVLACAEKFNQIYQPIRHGYFAHRGKATAEDIGELFGKTQIGDPRRLYAFSTRSCTQYGRYI